MKDIVIVTNLHTAYERLDSRQILENIHQQNRLIYIFADEQQKIRRLFTQTGVLNLIRCLIGHEQDSKNEIS